MSFFFFTYDSILKKLGRGESRICRTKREVDKLTKKYPLIKNLHESKSVNDGATRKEVEAVQSIWNLKFEMQIYVEREHYFRGYRDCILFMIHCGALGTNFDMV